MKFQVLEESKTMIRFQLPEETHTFANLLAAEIRKVDLQYASTYRVDHPLVYQNFMLKQTTRVKLLTKRAKTKLSESFSKSVKKL